MIPVEKCTACGRAQNPRRHACLHCGGTAFVTRPCRLAGTIFAVTAVFRAPSPSFEQLLPYVLVLVDLEDGVRIMGHGSHGLAIGDHVIAESFSHGGASLIRFRPAERPGLPG